MASIERAVQKTDEILQEVSAQAQSQWYGMRGASVTQPTGLGGLPENVPGVQSMSAEDIRSMPMSEYMKHRGNLRSAAAQDYYRRIGQ